MVPDMVSKRRVFLKLGYAYLLPEDIKGIIVSEFRAYLSRTLSKLSKYSSVYMKDDQVSLHARSSIMQIHHSHLSRAIPSQAETTFL